MQREIKFRAWNKGTGKMIDLYKTTPLALDANLNCDGIFIPFKPGYEIMQYTGLKDKNGKEIYEGDIIKYWYDRDMSGKDRCEYLEDVSWGRGPGNAIGFNICETHHPEVIGNIYETTQLLNP